MSSTPSPSSPAWHADFDELRPAVHKRVTAPRSPEVRRSPEGWVARWRRMSGREPQVVMSERDSEAFDRDVRFMVSVRAGA
jgi:hypothetical protein